MRVPAFLLNGPNYEPSRHLWEFAESRQQWLDSWNPNAVCWSGELDQRLSFYGIAVASQPSTIYINANSNKPFHFVIGHEFLLPPAPHSAGPGPALSGGSPTKAGGWKRNASDSTAKCDLAQLCARYASALQRVPTIGAELRSV
ncbi:hypothetical protein ACTMU2_30205 [Cupriavidus basilensis]